MELTILGVNSPYPRDGRATLGYFLGEGKTGLLLEAGCGTYRRLVEEGLSDLIGAVVLSHLHYDHCADLPGIVLGATVGRGGTGPLAVFLPPGEAERLKLWLGACGFSFVLEYLAPIEMTYGTPAIFGPWEITMRPGRHSLPAGIVTVAGEGGRFVYSGDTGDCPALREAMAGADLVLAEVSGLAPATAAEKGHLTAGELGAMAREAGPRELVVTHFMQGSDPEALADEVAGAFGRPVRMAREGQKYRVV